MSFIAAPDRARSMQLAPPATAARNSVSDLLRAWRAKRRLSQLEVGLTAGVSSRHLSFIETGRANASAELLVALADVLDMPLRAQCAAAGGGLRAALHRDRSRRAEHGCDAPGHHARARRSRPVPWCGAGRHWNIVIANATAQRLVEAVLRAAV